MSRPVRVSIAYTAASKRPDNHSTAPDAETPPMSGLPPGIVHVATLRLVAKRITETVPAARLETYRKRASRLGYRPCAPAPVRRKPVTRKREAAISHTPPNARSAT